jgi:predicted AAA+ superfamily ATPase
VIWWGWLGPRQVGKTMLADYEKQLGHPFEHKEKLEAL